LDGIEQRYFKQQQQKTDKTGSRLQKSEVLINTTKLQNQSSKFCLPKILIIILGFKVKN